MQNAKNSMAIQVQKQHLRSKDLVNLPKFQKIPKSPVVNVFTRKTFVFAENTCKNSILVVH